GTVPALIWKDVMKVATEPYGDRDFDYPQIDLNSYIPEKPVEVTEQVINNLDEAVENVRVQAREEIMNAPFEIPVAIPNEGY
ncbi:hypothetical protein IJV79_00135, partial [bacterium]|nr:hypothetical protein [bacterium]